MYSNCVLIHVGIMDLCFNSKNLSPASSIRWQQSRSNQAFCFPFLTLYCNDSMLGRPQVIVDAYSTVQMLPCLAEHRRWTLSLFGWLNPH